MSADPCVVCGGHPDEHRPTVHAYVSPAAADAPGRTSPDTLAAELRVFAELLTDAGVEPDGDVHLGPTNLRDLVALLGSAADALDARDGER